MPSWVCLPSRSRTSWWSKCKDKWC